MATSYDLTPFQGNPGYYFMTSVGGSYYGASRIVCLNCTAYFRTKCNKTQLDCGTHTGSMKTRFCPCCGSELTTLITPDSVDENQMKLELPETLVATSLLVTLEEKE